MSPEALVIPPPDDRKYIHVSHYGSGAEAEVYSATYVRTSQRVAIKVLKPQAGSGAAKTRRTHRFIQEATLLREITHPHVVRVYELLDVQLLGEETSAFVMEWLPWTFGQHLSRQSAGLSEEHLRGYLHHALAGLGALHGRRVAVRDLRRENLLLSEKGELKLADLGLARTEESAASLVESSRYVAPEILDGTIRAGRKEDPPPEAYFASDLYSLGFIFYEAAVGVERWERLPALESVYGRSGVGSGLDTNQRWREWHVDRGKRLLPVESVRRDLDPKLAGVLNRLVEKDRKARCGSVAEAQGLLGIGEGGGGTEVPKPPPVQSWVRRIARSRSAQVVAGVGLVVAAMWVGAGLFGTRDRAKAPSADRAPAVQRVSQAVRSEPAGAALYVDGQPRGRTPTVLNGLNLGQRYVLSLQLEGYVAWSETLRAEVGHGPVDVKLLVTRVGLRVVPNLPSARVYVDGEFRGQGSVQLQDMEVGRQYEIRVEETGYRTWERLVQASKSKDNLNVVLEAVPRREPRETGRPNPPEPRATSPVSQPGLTSPEVPHESTQSNTEARAAELATPRSASNVILTLPNSVVYRKDADNTVLVRAQVTTERRIRRVTISYSAPLGLKREQCMGLRGEGVYECRLPYPGQGPIRVVAHVATDEEEITSHVYTVNVLSPED